VSTSARPRERPAGGAPVAALALICGAQFVLQLDFSIVNVALPSIQRELGVLAAQLQWIVTGYALTFGSLLLVGSRLADLFGRRRLLIVGLILFALASVGARPAQSSVLLIGARVIQGAAGAMISPGARSLLTTMNPEGCERNRALGIWQATTAGGATTGIIAGGSLTQLLGWRAIFLVNPRLIVAMLVFVPRVIPARPPDGGEQSDTRGAVLGTSAIAALIVGLTEGQQHGFVSAGTVAALVAAVVLAAAFVITERTVPAPMLPLSLFSSRTRRGAVGAMVFQATRGRFLPAVGLRRRRPSRSLWPRTLMDAPLGSAVRRSSQVGQGDPPCGGRASRALQVTGRPRPRWSWSEHSWGSDGSVTDFGAMRSRAVGGLQWVLRGPPERNQP
jgi:MFS family permease